MMGKDLELPERLAENLKGCFEQVVITYQHELYAFAWRQTGHPQIAEDIVQEAFLRAYSTLQNYPSERIRTLKLQPWLYKVTLNVFYGHLRNIKLEETSLDEHVSSSVGTISDAWQDQPDRVVESKEWLQALDSSITLLPLQYRHLVNLYYFAEMNHREIAEMLNLPLGTVKSGLHRGTQLLRQSLQKQECEVR